LLDILKQQRIEHLSSGGSWDMVRKAICSAYFYNSAKIKGVGEYVNMLTGIPCNLHPSSSLYGLGYTPDYVTYHELIMTTKEYMSCVTAVEGEWLAELGPMFFTVKQSYKTRIEQRKKERDESKRMEAEMEEAVRKREEAERQMQAPQPTRAPALATPGRAAGYKTPKRVGL
jgi:pre-mRNA-splicing factor ATP-dependent RNA helicase DHX38/PRP16